MIFVPPPFAADAINEAIDAGIKVIAAITEGVPVLDMVEVLQNACAPADSVLIGAKTAPVLITPGECKIGIMPGYIHKPGKIGIISRSGTLTYEAVWQTTGIGLGQSTCVGIGGDPIVGTSYIDLLKLYQEDDQTEAILVIGEIGGDAEEQAAAFCEGACDQARCCVHRWSDRADWKNAWATPVRSFSGGKGTAAEKQAALEAAGIVVAPSPADMGKAIQEAINRRK